MRHLHPKLVYGLNQGPQTELISKLGGLPWGYPQKKWPNCAECGRPMQFLAQLKHDPPMFAFGEGAVLHAFLCNFDSICSFWDTDSGANSVFLLEESALGQGLTPYPAGAVAADQLGEQFTAFLELRLVGWHPFEDPLTEAQKPLFYDFDSYRALDDTVAIPHDFDMVKSNKAGQIPYWTANGPSPRLAKTDIFFQITGDCMPVSDTPPEPEVMLAHPGGARFGDVSAPDGGGMSFANWANFCLDGTGFFFREDTLAGTRYGLEILR